MEREVAWKKYDEASLDELEALAVDYIDFISENKTERECVNASIAMAEKAGYKSLAKAIKKATIRWLIASPPAHRWARAASCGPAPRARPSFSYMWGPHRSRRA